MAPVQHVILPQAQSFWHIKGSPESIFPAHGNKIDPDVPPARHGTIIAVPNEEKAIEMFKVTV